jgi:glycosyltransferase involved in cell wall biosynthesis
VSAAVPSAPAARSPGPAAPDRRWTGKILFCGAWDEGPGYPRAASLRQGLQRHGVEVVECRVEPLGAGKRRLLARPWRWPWLLLQLVRRRRRVRAALRAALHVHAPDAVLVPYPGHDLVGTVRSISRVPVVLDLFLSAYDTAVGDRALFRAGSWPARLLLRLDCRACAAADLVLVDTPENLEHVAALTGLPDDRFGCVPVGDPDAPDGPPSYEAPRAGPLRLLFFGTGVPLHGLPTLLEAVAVSPGVHLTLVGGTRADRELAARLLGDRLDLQPEFVGRARLQRLLDGAALVAGVFGRTPKAARVVPFKVVHALASGRPVVTAGTPAIRRVLQDGEGAFLVPAGDAGLLGARLRELAAAPDRLQAAAALARGVYDRNFAPAVIGARLGALLARLRSAEARR